MSGSLESVFLTDVVLHTWHSRPLMIGDYIFGYKIVNVERDMDKLGTRFIIDRSCPYEEETNDEMSYNTNGDIVETNDGQVFVFFGGQYYNLSTNKECRGRRHIKSELGPVRVIANMSGMGDLLKDARQEVDSRTPEFEFEEMPF